MSRVAVKYSKKLEENEMTIKRVTFSRLIEVSLSPRYQIISFSTEEFDLTKSGKGYLSGTVMHQKNLSKFPFEQQQNIQRLIYVEWKASSGSLPSSFKVKITQGSPVELKDMYKVNLKFGMALNYAISIFITIILLISFYFFIKQKLQYQGLFIYLVPKVTLFYMLIGDFILFIHQSIFHNIGLNIPIYLNLATGILFVGFVILPNLKHKGLKSRKTKLSVTMTIIIGMVTCLGFYGDNYFVEFCYSLFPLMIIFENSFIEILHYNRIINSVYVPLKTLQIFVNIIINDGWWVGSSY